MPKNMFHVMVSKMYNKYVLFKFNQKKVETKDFHRKKLLTNMLTIHVNKIVITDRVSRNKGKD